MSGIRAQPRCSHSSTAVTLPDTVHGVANACAPEALVAQPLRRGERGLLSGAHDGGDPFAGIPCPIAVHMHQPLIAACAEHLRTIALDARYRVPLTGWADARVHPVARRLPCRTRRCCPESRAPLSRLARR